MYYLHFNPDDAALRVPPPAHEAFAVSQALDALLPYAAPARPGLFMAIGGPGGLWLRDAEVRDILKLHGMQPHRWQRSAITRRAR